MKVDLEGLARNIESGRVRSKEAGYMVREMTRHIGEVEAENERLRWAVDEARANLEGTRKDRDSLEAERDSLRAALARLHGNEEDIEVLAVEIERLWDFEAEVERLRRALRLGCKNGPTSTVEATCDGCPLWVSDGDCMPALAETGES
jgi:chromosome segregation ATPase